VSEEIRRSGITYEGAIGATRRGGSTDFEGRKAKVVHLSQRSGRYTPHSARVEFDPGDGYLTLLGFFRGEEFMEGAHERPFSGTT
jgi:hypothetical protein